MAIRIVTYDLNTEISKADYDGFYKVIKQGAWARLSESSYIMDTNLSPQQIYKQLEPYFDKNDNVTILTLCSPWYGQNAQDVIDWLQARLSVN